jgi:hypothetical protein
MESKQGLHRTGALDVETTLRLAEEAGFATFVMPAKGIVDMHSFFEAVQATFPLDPPLVLLRSWDALSDSLWQGLYTLGARRIAILWPSTQAMAVSAPSDFETAMNVLADVASSLADPELTCETPKEVVVLVE